MMGNMVSTLSLTRLQKYSLFQKYKARSATLQRESVPGYRKSNEGLLTWKWGLATDFAS
jgi:hypothetical protein